MAPTSSSPRPRPRRSGTRRRAKAPAWPRRLAWVGVFLLTTAALLWGMHRLGFRPEAPPTARTERSTAKPAPPRAAAPRPAEAPPGRTPPPSAPAPIPAPSPGAKPPELYAALPPGPPPEPPVPRARPRVALIIDDIGYDRPLAEKLIALDAPLTFAVLPHSPHQKALARLADARGREILLHLPMEPREYPAVDPGPGALLAAMTPDALLEELERDLRAVPFARGVNNHMGSRLTADADRMNQVFSVLKRRGLFFVDSRTSEESTCRSAARLFQVPFAQRDVFLDHRPEPEFIRRQLAALVRLARSRGEAIGIAHPHPTTYAVLREEMPRLQDELEFVPASRLARLIE